MSVANSSSDPAPLWRAAAVVRDRGDVLDGPDLQAGGLQRADRGLTTRAGTLHEHVDLAHAVLHGPPRGGLSGHLSGERRRLARALEADLPGRRPGDHAAAGIGDRDDGVVEGALDVRMAVRDVLAFLPADLLGAGGTASGRHSAPRSSGGGRTGCAPPHGGRTRRAADYFLPAFFLPATVFFLPLRVRALVWVRWPCTGSPR